MNVWETLEVVWGGCRWFSSTQNESCRARGDCPIVNRLRMVSFSRADKKKCKK